VVVLVVILGRDLAWVKGIADQEDGFGYRGEFGEEWVVYAVSETGCEGKPVGGELVCCGNMGRVGEEAADGGGL